MSYFQEWLRRRDYRETSFNSNDGDDYAQDYDRLQSELVKTVFTKYNDEMMQFLDGIAQRGDQEINALLKQLRRSNQPAHYQEPDHPSDMDEVVPSSADSGHSNGNFGD